MKFFAKITSTGLFTGYLFASGTFGSIVGIFLYVFIFQHTGNLYVFSIMVFSIFGIFISDFAEKKIFKVKDPKEIVIDEIAGILVSLCGVSIYGGKFYLLKLLIVFIFFRFFDIVKPYPIKKVQKLDGGLGIMFDDIIAGLYTSILSGLTFKFLKL